MDLDVSTAVLLLLLLLFKEKNRTRLDLLSIPQSGGNDSHVQRIALATEETTVTQQVSHRPIKCQSRLWPQRGMEVNGSHHGTPYSNQQGSESRQKVMRLYKQWHRPISKRFIKPPYSILSRATSIDSDCCRLPTTSVLSNKLDKLRFSQFLSTNPTFSRPHIVEK